MRISAEQRTMAVHQLQRFSANRQSHTDLTKCVPAPPLCITLKPANESAHLLGTAPGGQAADRRAKPAIGKPCTSCSLSLACQDPASFWLPSASLAHPAVCHWHVEIQLYPTCKTQSSDKVPLACERVLSACQSASWLGLCMLSTCQMNCYKQQPSRSPICRVLIVCKSS